MAMTVMGVMRGWSTATTTMGVSLCSFGRALGIIKMMMTSQYFVAVIVFDDVDVDVDALVGILTDDGCLCRM